MCDGLITEPLSPDGLLNLVDPHARGAKDTAGFDGALLLREAMPGYQVYRLVSSDYLGQVARKWPAVRGIADVVFRAFLPQHGSMLSWLVRKPADCGSPDPSPQKTMEGVACAG